MSVSFSGSGQVVSQVISTFLTTTFTSTSTTYTDVTGLSVTITPRNSANKIMVFYNFQASTTNGENSVMFQLVRGSTPIATGVAASNRPAASSYNRSVSACGDQSWAMAMNFLDSPATTSATTYKIQGLAQSGATFSVNRTIPDTDAVVIPRFGATITVMEIAYA
jgi:hypothetical protein